VGPLLDHGVGFNFDCFYFTALVTSGHWPGISRLPKIAGPPDVGSGGLLPVENTGVPAVIDHQAYRQQRYASAQPCGCHVETARLSWRELGDDAMPV
jgi:hypothetical protein